MTDEEQEQKPIEAENEPIKPKIRELIIETDGTGVNIKKCEVTALETKEICRMLLKQLGG